MSVLSSETVVNPPQKKSWRKSKISVHVHTGLIVFWTRTSYLFGALWTVVSNDGDFTDVNVRPGRTGKVGMLI